MDSAIFFFIPGLSYAPHNFFSCRMAACIVQRGRRRSVFDDMGLKSVYPLSCIFKGGDAVLLTERERKYPPLLSAVLRCLSILSFPPYHRSVRSTSLKKSHRRCSLHYSIRVNRGGRRLKRWSQVSMPEKLWVALRKLSVLVLLLARR